MPAAKPRRKPSIWIPVKRRMPESGLLCWVWRLGNPQLVIRRPDSWQGVFGVTYWDSSDERITHWTPVKAPKGPTA